MLRTLGFALAVTIAGTSTARAGIVKGSPVPACGWPATVYMNGSVVCTGTLVHPRVVIYAAHCGSEVGEVDFGEWSLPASRVVRKVKTEYCRANPGFKGAGTTDYAFCKLAEEISEVPIVPIAMGCENDLVKVGQPVTLVGFGLDENMTSGRKRTLDATIRGLPVAGTITIGADGGAGACSGDSGGPAFVKGADGIWRVFGIASSVMGGCGGLTNYGLMAGAVPWVEQESGVDITPCHDADGKWNPGSGCGRFPLEPGKGGQEWPAACQGGPISGQSSSCGSPSMGGGGMAGTGGTGGSGGTAGAGAAGGNDGRGGTAGSDGSGAGGTGNNGSGPSGGCSLGGAASSTAPLIMLAAFVLVRRRWRFI